MSDTIVACATPFGTGAVAVVRVSGSGAAQVVRSVCGRLPPHRRATLVRLCDVEGPFDEGLLTWFVGPSSYTGEDVAEISCHGNPLLVARLLRACEAAGARAASPGEFTRRAFLHGKLDLVQAEAVLETIEATSERGLDLARRVLDGALGSVLDGVRSRVVETASELEAILDYPGEDLLFREDDAIGRDLAEVAAIVTGLLATAGAGRVAVEGARVAIVGPVNAGKSTLLNALAGRTRAIVSPTAGTTRDVVEVAVQLRELRLTLLDTAGERVTDDPIEAAGLALGREEAARADLRLLLLPAHLPWDADWDALVAACRPPFLLVGTHADRVGPADASGRWPRSPDLWLSGRTGAGVDALVDAIRARLALVPASGDAAPGSAEVYLTTRRQEELVRGLQGELTLAARALSDGAGPAVVVEALYGALRSVDALLGRDTREDVLDRLFARFCVGK